MELLGKHIIGAERIGTNSNSFKAVNPANGELLPIDFVEGGIADVDKAAKLAGEAFLSYSSLSNSKRADFLEQIGVEIEALGDVLIERAVLETGLPAARILGERGRTIGQLGLFASVLRAGNYLDARIERADPNRQPLPKPDTRLTSVALGPVAVFGASNFPLAFSVAGGDTASALAAGCPVVVKAHRSHPGVSELVALAIQKAVANCGLHEGVFSMLHGTGRGVGAPLVQHPTIRAVGFTGSLSGGRALYDLATSRAVPIPFYGELASINPVYLLPNKLQSDTEALAQQFVASLTLGVGQFCTNPGLVIAIKSPALDKFTKAASGHMIDVDAGVMLSPGISDSYKQGVADLGLAKSVELISCGRDSEVGSRACAHIFKTSAANFLNNEALSEEVFGPCSLLVECDDFAQMLEVTTQLEGQLTATLHSDDDDQQYAHQLLPLLADRVGRILFNGFPTGVEVGHSMNHGGPYPSSTDARATSVGSAAIKRFIRPVCYQDTPQELLPESLKDSNPLGIWRLVDGQLER